MSGRFESSGERTADLVRRAGQGDQGAWNELVDQFSALVWSVCRLFHLGDADRSDVSQTVWLRLVEHLHTLRDPAALPGWLAKTTRNECLRVVGHRNRQSFLPGDELLERTADPDADQLDAGIEVAQRRAAIREALASLPEHCRQLLELLALADRPDYRRIGTTLNMPVGSIGPTRARCLKKLRDRPELRGWAPGSQQEED